MDFFLKCNGFLYTWHLLRSEGLGSKYPVNSWELVRAQQVNGTFSRAFQPSFSLRDKMLSRDGMLSRDKMLSRDGMLSRDKILSSDKMLSRDGNPSSEGIPSLDQVDKV